MTTWTDNLELVRDLWPKWTQTPAQAALWNDTLAQYRQTWLREAILEHARLDGPRDAPFHEPRLSRIIARYSAIAEAGERHAPVSHAERPWRACWTVTIRGRPVAMSSLAVFADRAAALDHAARMGDRPDAIVVGGTQRTPEDYARLAMRIAADVLRARAELSAMPRPRLDAAIRRAVDVGWAVGLRDEDVAGAVGQWSDTTVLVVAACSSLPPRPAQTEPRQPACGLRETLRPTSDTTRGSDAADAIVDGYGAVRYSVEDDFWEED
jgi:hypothetical protein